MTEIKPKNTVIDENFHSIQKQLLVDMSQEFGTDLGHKKICKSVAKEEKIGNKINKILIQSFNVKTILFALITTDFSNNHFLITFCLFCFLVYFRKILSESSIKWLTKSNQMKPFMTTI